MYIFLGSLRSVIVNDPCKRGFLIVKAKGKFGELRIVSLRSSTILIQRSIVIITIDRKFRINLGAGNYLFRVQIKLSFVSQNRIGRLTEEPMVENFRVSRCQQRIHKSLIFGTIVRRNRRIRMHGLHWS